MRTQGKNTKSAIEGAPSSYQKRYMLIQFKLMIALFATVYSGFSYSLSSDNTLFDAFYTPGFVFFVFLFYRERRNFATIMRTLPVEVYDFFTKQGEKVLKVVEVSSLDHVRTFQLTTSAMRYEIVFNTLSKSILKMESLGR